MFVVYATIPIVVVMVMIVATCVFARRFAVKLRRKVGNGHTAIHRTTSGPTSSQNSGNGNLHQPTDSIQKMCCSDCCCMRKCSLVIPQGEMHRNYIIVVHLLLINFQHFYSCFICIPCVTVLKRFLIPSSSEDLEFLVDFVKI